MAVFGGFVVGKPLGVLAFSWLAVRWGIARRPPDLAWRLVAGGGMLAGIGFTMALFIANLAFSPDLIGEAKLGIFAASVVSAAAGLAMLATSPRASRIARRCLTHQDDIRGCDHSDSGPFRPLRHDRMCLPRLDGAAIIGHDRLDELLVGHVSFGSPGALQLLTPPSLRV